MTTYTDEVNIYNPDAISGAIDDAGNAYKTYITEVTSDGIMVAAAGKGTSNGSIVSTTTGWHLSDVLEWVRNGVSRFWIGLKNQGDTTPTVRIGKAYVSGATDNESHMELDYHSMQLVDKEGDTYFDVGDLRDQNGVATISESFSQRYCQVSAIASEIVRVTSNGVETSDYSLIRLAPSMEIQGVEIGSSVQDVSNIVVTYTTVSDKAKAYTLGTRLGDSGLHSYAIGYGCTASGANSTAVGAGSNATGKISYAEGNGTTASGRSSHAEGVNTVASNHASHAEGMEAEASGYYSHAQNQGTKAASTNQTALGKYNIEDANGDYAVIVGNGTADNARSNAAALQWDGTLELAKALPIASGGTGATTAAGARVNLGCVGLNSDSDMFSLRYYVTQSNQKRLYVYAANGAQLGYINFDG